MKHLTDIMPQINALVAYAYDEIKTDETDALINHFLSHGQVGDTPLFIHVSGIPGAGKTTYIDANEQPGMVRIQFDLIMKHLKEYDKMVQEKGAAIAFSAFEMPARVIGYELLRQALAAHYNIIFEHSLNPIHTDLYHFLHANGYTTHLVFINCSVEVALNRVRERELIIGRHTPADFITQRFKLAQEYLPRFKELAHTCSLLDS